MRRILSKLYVFATMFATLFASCQQESDDMSGNINGLGLEAYAKTYTEMWDVLWNGFNQNYVGWENETRDWDEVNAVTRPKLVALDAKYDTLSNLGKRSELGKSVADEAAQLFHAAFDSLHDGHTSAYYIDRYTNQHERLTPNLLRLQQRKDYSDMNFKPLVKEYFIEQGDIVRDSVKTFVGIEVACELLKKEIFPQMQYDYANLNPTTDDETIYKNNLDSCISTIEQILKDSLRSATDIGKAIEKEVFGNSDYADIIQHYNLYKFNFNFPQMQLFFTKDNIAYFWLSSFANWPGQENTASNNTKVYDYIEKRFYKMLEGWHDQVYKLHAERKLTGVVLDVRGNIDGDVANLKNFAGLLFKGGNWQIGTQKFKNGIGRLDYTESIPFYFPCYEKNSEDITEPIVILTNIASKSCSEFSTAAVKTHENGISIGSRTYGAGAAFYPDGTTYPITNYSGTIGIVGETNVLAYISVSTTNFGGGIGNIEGKGITPDIEVPLDNNLYVSQGRDNQFERALEYIREKNSKD